MCLLLVLGSIVFAFFDRHTGAREAGGESLDFVRVANGQFMVGDKPLRFIGLNMWQAVHLAAFNPDRLRQELEQLHDNGIQVLRINAASEGLPNAPLQAVPALQPRPGIFNETIAIALDRVLVELDARQMKALLVLNNMWTWSGGFAQYIIWAHKQDWQHIPFPPAGASYWRTYLRTPGYVPSTDASWDAYQLWASQFYQTSEAVLFAQRTIEFLLGRRNSISGRMYANDPTIFAWELCNEPRAVAPPNARGVLQASFMAWVASTAATIKRLAPRHMVTIGSEGWTPYPSYVNVNFTAAHMDASIDFATVHIWPQNWDWYNPLASRHAPQGFTVAMERSLAYLDIHTQAARALGKPLVLEEFGLARDSGRLSRGSSVGRRDRFFSALLRRAAAAPEVGGVLAWAWGGAGHPSPSGWWQPTQSDGIDLVGDPPHEQQGWYSIYTSDSSTLALLRNGFRLKYTPDPPWAPAPPAAPPQPTPPWSPPRCISGVNDDVGFEACESWCDQPTHCAMCKCVACHLCAAGPGLSISVRSKQGPKEAHRVHISKGKP